jgi:hypothetical protein
MKPKKRNKKRAPRDATMRNVRAGNKKFEQIDQHLKATPKEWIEGHYARRILLEMSNTLWTNLADVRRMVEP